MDRFFHDIRYSIRTLARTTDFTLIAVLTLALGIGVNTTIFSVVYHVLMKPLTVVEPERLVHIWETNTKHNITRPARRWPTLRTGDRKFVPLKRWQDTSEGILR